MANEFSLTFSEYSNVELLKIVKRPNDYQPDALNAATEIIATRTITENDHREADEYLAAIEEKHRKKQESVELLGKKASDLFQPILQPGSIVSPNKWLNLLLLMVAIQYLWSLYKTAKYLINFYQCMGCRLDITIIGGLLNLIYVPFVFYLLFRRNKWGWILLLADNLFSVFSLLGQSYMFFKYRDIFGGDMSDYIWSLMIKSAFVAFLLRQEIASYFGVAEIEKKKYAFIISAILLTATIGFLGITMQK